MINKDLRAHHDISSQQSFQNEYDKENEEPGLMTKYLQLKSIDVSPVQENPEKQHKTKKNAYPHEEGSIAERIKQKQHL
jgi:hypothetical protein